MKTNETKGQVFSDKACTNNTAILVVSFGTSYPETRKKTIDRIEEDIRASYPQYPFYRAWTSRFVMAKLKKRDGIHIMDVREAMEKMREDGIRRVIVQPTYVLTAIESDYMRQETNACREWFDSVAISDSLIVTQEDKEEIVRCMAEEYHPAEDEILLLMGHGTEHAANALYEELDGLFKDMGYSNIFMGTVEGDFSLENFMEILKERKPSRVLLAPFMIVAGDHACNDMAGDEPDSWKSILEKDGFAVSCSIQGLGELSAVRKIFIRHTAEAQKRLQ